MTPAKSPSPRLFKTIFQARYAPSLAFYARFAEAASEFENYPKWETTWNSVVRQDYAHMCSMIVRHDFLAYEQDNEDEELEKERVHQLLSDVPTALGIERFTRLGLRRRYLVPTGMAFSELVSVFELKFMSPRHVDVPGVPSDLEDLMYRADMRDGDDRFHIGLGPVHRDELPLALGLNHDRHLDPSSPDQLEIVLDSYPDVALFIDVDLYRDEDDCAVGVANDFYKSACDRLSQIANGYADYCFSQKVA
ncbi:MAG: hypothetical protein HOH43_00010 [Candidatus Latescibacteria bacterium]|jgi:pterin-4a-carbinolamine dehydratase|nr:hypothetical protein [Candidatus Latescibacterota bacterium]